MNKVSEVSMQLHVRKTDRNREVCDRHRGTICYQTSKGSLIFEPIPDFGWHDRTRVEVPQEILDLDPTPIIHFREDLTSNSVQICMGLSGRPMRPYFIGQGFLDDGAYFSVPSRAIVLSAELQDNETTVLTSLRQFSVAAGNGIAAMNETIIFQDLSFLPERFAKFALPYKLATRYLTSSDRYEPLYWDQTDSWITGCFGEGDVPIYCLGCTRQHAIPMETLLADPEARLLLLRNYGYHGSLRDGYKSEVRDGTLPQHLCPNYIKYGKKG